MVSSGMLRHVALVRATRRNIPEDTILQRIVGLPLLMMYLVISNIKCEFINQPQFKTMHDLSYKERSKIFTHMISIDTTLVQKHHIPYYKIKQTLNYTGVHNDIIILNPHKYPYFIPSQVAVENQKREILYK
jgi:hypothetical protein